MALLMAAGCSSTVDGAAQTGDSPGRSASMAASAVTVNSAVLPPPPSLSATATIAPTAISSGAPAILDEASENWFTTYCLGAAEVAGYATQAPTGGSVAELQASVAAIYSDIAISASTSVGVLQATPAPTVDGGDDLQVHALQYFSFLSDVYGRGAVTIDGLTPTAESDLQAAVQAIEQEAAASAPTAMTGVDGAVLAAARMLPECQGVL